VATWETGVNGRIIFTGMFKERIGVCGLDSLDSGVASHGRLL
jgi:hypothetical protein